MITLEMLSEAAEKAFKEYLMFALRKFLFDLRGKKTPEELSCVLLRKFFQRDHNRDHTAMCSFSRVQRKRRCCKAHVLKQQHGSISVQGFPGQQPGITFGPQKNYH